MANIRVSVIHHEDRHVDLSPKGTKSIGQQIDQMINDSLAVGNLIHEIRFQVEESEANRMLDSFFRNRVVEEATIG